MRIILVLLIIAAPIFAGRHHQHWRTTSADGFPLPPLPPPPMHVADASMVLLPAMLALDVGEQNQENRMAGIANGDHIAVTHLNANGLECEQVMALIQAAVPDNGEQRMPLVRVLNFQSSQLSEVVLLQVITLIGMSRMPSLSTLMLPRDAGPAPYIEELQNTCARQGVALIVAESAAE